MFKKLKDKIAEEVKQSPLKSVQQFAQAVVSPTSSSVFEPSSSDDKFCIEEGDIEEDESSSTKEPTGGFTSVTLTGQTSPPVRSLGTTETESLFPIYESQTTHFHVQSDWESASEVEDRGQLDHISKENLYDAYRKVYGRYNKMKNKYHELVTHYRQLERENDKAKNVLSETQDKALLRVSELREQCLLEQQAKAHLEEALRNELEEKDHIISSLKTKVQYLKTVNEGAPPDNQKTTNLPRQEIDNLIDFTENACVSKVPSPFGASSNFETVEWLDERVNNCKKFLMDKTTKLENIKSQLEKLKEASLNIRTNRTEETETSGGDKLFALENEPRVESNVYQSIVNVVNEFSKEIKVIQETTKSFMFGEDVDKSVDQESIVVECHDKPLKRTVSEDTLLNSAHSQENRADIDFGRHISNAKDVCDLHNDELKKLYQTINEFEIQNEMINKKLMEEKKNTDQMQTIVIELNKSVDFVNTQLKTTNELLEQGTFNIDKLNLTQLGDNDLAINLKTFITNYVNTKSELETFKSAVVNLKNEVKTTKNELDFLKMNEKSRVECAENQKYSQDENLMEINNELKEQLERLKNENDVRLAHQQSLCLEINCMKDINTKLELQIEEIKVLLDSSEKQCQRNNEELNLINQAFDEEKKVLQNNINKLNIELEYTKKELTNLLDLNELSSSKLSLLQKENDCNFAEKESLRIQIEELKNQSKQYEQQYLTLKTLYTSLSEELTSLKGEQNNSTSEKSTLLENIYKLENLIKDLQDDLTTSKIENETLQNELLLVKTNNNDIYTEKKLFQNKIIELENEIKQIKEECSSINHLKDSASNELFTLKQEYDSLVLEKKNLNEQINKLVLELGNRMKDHSIGVEEKEKLSADIVNLREDYDTINTERHELKIKLDGLQTELEIKKTNCDSFMALNKQLSEEISALKETIDEINKEKNKLQIKIIELENEKSNTHLTEKNLLLNNLDSLKTELELSKQEYDKYTKHISIEVASLNKEKDELEKEKKTLQSLIDDLQAKINTKEEDYASWEESNKKLINEIRLSKINYDNLSKEKETLLIKLKNLNVEVQNCKLEVASSIKIRDGLSDKILMLTQEVEAKTNETDILRRKLDELAQTCKNDKKNHETMIEENKRLTNKIVLIKTQFEEVVLTLNKTKEQLESQQDSCAKLNNQLQALRESYNSKCDDICGQEKQNIQLKNDVANLTTQLNQINASIESITNERDYLFNSVVANMTTLRNIRKEQLKLFSFVSQFKEEITSELSNIKLKVSKDLMFQVNTALKTNEDYNKHIVELEAKTKKDIDSYNSKIKSIQAQLQNDGAIGNCNQTVLQISNTHQLDHVSNSELLLEIEPELEKKLCELHSNIAVYKSKCNDLEVSLNHAVLIMKSIRSFLRAKFDNSMLKEQVLILERKEEKILETEENECIVRQHQIAAIESFLKEYQSMDLENKHSSHEFNLCLGPKMSDEFSSLLGINSANNGSVRSPINLDSDCIHEESNEFNQHAAIKKVEEVYLKTKSSNFKDQIDNTSLEIQQLKKEVKLKEDIIKKLQYVIEEYEQNRSVLANNQVKCKENAATYDIMDAKMEDDPVMKTEIDDNVTNIHSEKYKRLEQENGILLKQIETMKHIHEENIKQLSASFENKLKESEEIIKLNEHEKSGKEKKFILNEMKEQIENLQHDLDERGDAFETLYEEHQQLTKSRDIELLQLRSNYEKEMREQDKKWRSCLDRKLAEEESRHNEEVNILTCKWAAQRKELETASQLAMSVVGSGSNSIDLLRHQVQSLTLQVAQLENERCEGREWHRSPLPARTIQDCTEMEYLRNILYDYMMGKEPVVLAKVLCALMKFSENQTTNIVTKEEQRLTLFGQLGIL